MKDLCDLEWEKVKPTVNISYDEWLEIQEREERRRRADQDAFVKIICGAVIAILLVFMGIFMRGVIYTFLILILVGGTAYLGIKVYLSEKKRKLKEQERKKERERKKKRDKKKNRNKGHRRRRKK